MKHPDYTECYSKKGPKMLNKSTVNKNIINIWSNNMTKKRITRRKWRVTVCKSDIWKATAVLVLVISTAAFEPRTNDRTVDRCVIITPTVFTTMPC